MNLQEILGDAFHEGITIDEINTALSGKKLADLSTGAYVDKNKYDADIKAKESEIQKKAEALHQKMSEDEKKAANEAEKDALIQQLQNQIKDQVISTNRSKAESLTGDVKSILDVKSDDTSYVTFLDVLSTLENDNSSTVANYVNKLVKDSYEKGKKDAVRDNLGNFSKGVEKQGTGSDGSKDIGSFGKKLAESTKPVTDPNLYFKRN